jgi:hypothetical protein
MPPTASNSAANPSCCPTKAVPVLANRGVLTGGDETAAVVLRVTVAAVEREARVLLLAAPVRAT